MALFQSMLDMFNGIKKNQAFPLDWNKMLVQTIKKKNGTMKNLNSYIGIFLVLIMNFIFEKLINFVYLSLCCTNACFLDK